MAIKKKITATSIKELKPEDKRQNDTELSGFHARIFDGGNISYYIYYRHKGKQVNFKLGNHPIITPIQARDLAKDKLAEVTKGVDVQTVKKEDRIQTKLAKLSTLEVFLEQSYSPWLFSRNAKTADKAMKSFKSSFSEFYDFQLSDINAWELEKWRSKRLKKGLKPATVNRQITQLQGCLSRAVEWGVIESHDLSKVKALQVDNSKVRYLDSLEEKRLKKALRDRDNEIKVQRTSANEFRQSRNYELLTDLNQYEFADHLEPVVLIAMNTGMRKGEILSLEWEQVDFGNRIITVVSDKAKSGKTRHIPMNNIAYNALANWKELSGKKGYVFKGENNTHLLDVKKGWDSLLERALITNFRFHDLRHHFASKLVMASVDLNTVRELLGHKDLTMTLRYAHLAPEHKAAAVNLIG
ncbi:site-specific integrase [Thalassotalea atypica]|uniref:site-specific integrase n=1 Tax=Thalassotalea atypica TaxID=2054316 RepID=UPI0025737A96|nr:site-specific integrase [Thalassotalea atypica]